MYSIASKKRRRMRSPRFGRTVMYRFLSRRCLKNFTITFVMFYIFLTLITLLHTKPENGQEMAEQRFQARAKRHETRIDSQRKTKKELDTRRPNNRLKHSNITRYHEKRSLVNKMRVFDQENIAQLKFGANNNSLGQAKVHSPIAVARNKSARRIYIRKYRHRAFVDAALKNKAWKPTWDQVMDTDECRIYNEDLKRNFTIHRDILLAYSPGMKHDLVMMTQLSMDRISSFKRMVLQWRGPIAAGIYIEPETLLDVVEDFRFWRDQNNVRDCVIHLVIKTGHLYPVNFMRNLVLDQVHSDYVFLIDADFVTSDGLRSEIRKYINTGFFQNDKKVLAVPEFAFNASSQEPVPYTKEEARRQFGTSLQPFDFGNPQYKAEESPTNFKQWFNTTETYTVNYQAAYEPYFVIKREHVPRYNENFLARWYDKVSNVIEIMNNCFQMYVLPTGFVVHISHPSVMGDPLVHNTFRCVFRTYWRSFVLELNSRNTGCLPFVRLPLLNDSNLNITSVGFNSPTDPT